jgi:hypothetical protein
MASMTALEVVLAVAVPFAAVPNEAAGWATFAEDSCSYSC